MVQLGTARAAPAQRLGPSLQLSSGGRAQQKAAPRGFACCGPRCRAQGVEPVPLHHTGLLAQHAPSSTGPCLQVCAPSSHPRRYLAALSPLSRRTLTPARLRTAPPPRRMWPPTAAHRRTPPHTAAHCRTLPPPSTLCTLTGGARLTAARIALPSRLQCVYSASTVRAWCMAWLALLVPPPPRPQLAGPRCMWASPSPSPNPSQALALHENASKPSEDGRAPPPSNHSSQPAAAPPKRRTVRRPCPAAAARCCRHLCGCCRDPQPTPPPCRDRPPWVRASTAASTTAAKWTTPLLTTTRRRPS